MTVTWDSRVVEIHLPEQADELARTAISTFQRRHVPPSPTGLMDAGRVLVVGSCAALCDAEASLERLIEAPSVLRVLCMVVDDGDGALPPALRLPRLLDQSRSVGTLWIGDGRGVLWRMGTTKAQAITTLSQEGTEGLPVGSVLAALREPEVFDATFSAATSSGHVFSPALHVFVPSTTPSVIMASERAAVRALAGDDSAPVAALLRPSDLEDEAFLLGNAPNPAELFDHRGPTGQLAGQVQACIDSAQASLQRVASVRGGSVASDAVAQVQAVGRALDALHGFQRDELFAKINGSDGLDPTEVGILKAAGLRSAAITEATAVDIDKYRIRLRDLAVRALERTRSLSAVSGELRGLAALATPRSTEDTVDALDRCCPEELRAHLRNYPKLSLRLSSGPGLLLLWLVFAALALVPMPFTAIPLGAILTGMLVLFTTASDATSQTLRSYVSTERRQLVPALCVVVLGGLCGALLRLQSPSAGLTVAGIVVTPLACATWLRVLWIQSARRWVKGSRVGEAAQTLARLLDLTAAVATNDWILANPRLQLADGAARLANGLEELRAALLKDMPEIMSADPLQQDGHLVVNPAVSNDLADVQGRALMQRAGDARDIVMQDYLELVASAIDDRWFTLMMSAEDKDSDIADGFLASMGAYRRALYTEGLFATAFAGEDRASSRRKSELLANLWRETDGVAELLGTSAAGDLVQLCAAEHLTYLDEEPGRAQMVRFAPDAYRPGPGGLAVVQTRSLLMAGVIRLVPVRGGIAEFGLEQAESVRGDGELLSLVSH